MTEIYTVACQVRSDKRGKTLNPLCYGGFKMTKQQWEAKPRCVCGVDYTVLDIYLEIPIEELKHATN